MNKKKKVVSIETHAAIIVTAALNKHFNIVGCDLNDKAYDVMQALLQCKDKDYKYNEETKEFLSYSIVALAKKGINYTELSKGEGWEILAKVAKKIKNVKQVAENYSKPSILAKAR